VSDQKLTDNHLERDRNKKFVNVKNRNKNKQPMGSDAQLAPPGESKHSSANYMSILMMT